MQKIKNFEQLPFKDPAYEDVWFASFEATEPRVPGHRLYVPKEITPNCMSAAFNAAFNLGTMMQQTKVYKAFHVCIDQGEDAGQTIGWPIIHLLPVTDGVTCCNTATEAAKMRIALLEIIASKHPLADGYGIAYAALGGRWSQDGADPIDLQIFNEERLRLIQNPKKEGT